jgi:hypothetical protein
VSTESEIATRNGHKFFQENHRKRIQLTLHLLSVHTQFNKSLHSFRREH